MLCGSGRRNGMAALLTKPSSGSQGTATLFTETRRSGQFLSPEKRFGGLAKRLLRLPLLEKWHSARLSRVRVRVLWFVKWLSPVHAPSACNDVRVAKLNT